MVLAEYAKRMVLFEAEGYRPPTIAKMLESEGIFVSRWAVAKVFTKIEFPYRNNQVGTSL